MLLLTEPTLFYWNFANELIDELKDACTDTVSVWAQGVEMPTVTTGAKRVAGTAVDVSDGMPPPKRIKTEAMLEVKQPNATIERKYKNSDLPFGCLDHNAWRGIDDKILILILMKAWKVVYAENLSLKYYYILPSSPVYHLSKEQLSEWRNGFGSAAIMILMSFMASDTAAFSTYEERSAFANFHLDGNRFLFEDASADDKKKWKGMWQSPLVLQHLQRTSVTLEAVYLSKTSEVKNSSVEQRLRSLLLRLTQSASPFDRSDEFRD
ncbi:hypothetical protein DFH29DRAFT_1007285 [Suillus ampliporus]|nr:hypothetical protein DFH29DRAFT_1007285 [Suillus ampliporus]